MNTYDKPPREVPVNELDLQLQTINPEWGKYIDQDFKKRLESAQGAELDGLLWELLQFYTRDIRLGNLSQLTGELEYCRYYLDLAADLLEHGYRKSFIIALSRAITVIETSQSKGGFLRRRHGTITQESNINENREPPKRGIFGQKKGEV